MRILVLSDVHANLAALDAVLAAAGPFDRVWCLGDVVGYGPDPDACIERLRSLDLLCLAGNHDLAVAGRLPLEDFNPDARAAALWTRTRLGEEGRAWLESLEPLRVVDGLDLTLAHGSPVDPVWDYIQDPAAARAAFGACGTRLCLVGHSHVPILFRESGPGGRVSEERIRTGSPTSLARGRSLVNPGSVGQPRDGDPRAAFAILETGTMVFTQLRAEYDIAATQRRMEEAGLPGGLVRRLRHGR